MGHVNRRAVLTSLPVAASVAAEYAGTPIDVLINKAGIIGPIPIQDHLDTQHFGTIDYEVWEQVVRTNTFAPIKMAEVFVDNVLAGEKKKIITLSSTVGSFQKDKTPALCYCTSKTAVTKAVQLMSEALRELGIMAMAFCPATSRRAWALAAQPLKSPTVYLECAV